MDLWCPAEKAIAAAVAAVEAMPADTRLTDAVCLLGRARDRVADFVDGVESDQKCDCAPPPAPQEVQTADTVRTDAPKSTTTAS